MAWLVTVARHELLTLLHKSRRELITSEEQLTADCRCDLELALGARARRTEREPTPAALAGGRRLHPVELIELTGKTYTWVNRHLSKGARGS